MKIEKGDEILSLDQMIARDFVYLGEKIYRPEWLYPYTLEFILERMRRGEIREVLLEDPLTGEMQAQVNWYNLDETGRPMTASEIKRDREWNR